MKTSLCVAAKPAMFCGLSPWVAGGRYFRFPFGADIPGLHFLVPGWYVSANAQPVGDKFSMSAAT